ncbi:hypothetical protein NFI96_017081 [Prochilodus magdalenae]|nr:hypothetical protein NFI96_017081 [Prochilodus magdalenae]
MVIKGFGCKGLRPSFLTATRKYHFIYMSCRRDWVLLSAEFPEERSSLMTLCIGHFHAEVSFGQKVGVILFFVCAG